MRKLDFKLYFGFVCGFGEGAESEATDVEFSDSLYNMLKEIYVKTGETYLHAILDEEKLPTQEQKELEKIIQKLKYDIISNEDYCNANMIEDLIIYIDTVIPDEWEKEYTERNNLQWL